MKIAVPTILLIISEKTSKDVKVPVVRGPRGSFDITILIVKCISL